MLRDNRCVDLRSQDSATIQMFFCNGGSTQKFQLRRNANGSYKISAINGGKNSFLGAAKDEDALIFVVHSCASSCTVSSWNIQPVPGTTSVQIAAADGTELGAATLLSLKGLLWDRRTPDDQGRIQLKQPIGGARSEFFSFERVR